MIDHTYIEDFLEDEINFHYEVKTPLLVKIACHITGKKTPCEAVCDELAWVRHYITMLTDVERAKKLKACYEQGTNTGTNHYVITNGSPYNEWKRWEDASD